MNGINNKLKWHISTWLIFGLVILNILDFETTRIALGQGLIETNPILAYLMATTGTIWAIFWAKFIVLSLLFLPYTFIEKHRQRCQTVTMVWIFIGLNIIYLGVVISNLIKLIG